MPPQVKVQSLYQQCVEHLTGQGATTIEQAVIDGERPQDIDLGVFMEKLRRLLDGDGDPSWQAWRRETPTDIAGLDQVLTFSRLYAEVRLVMDKSDAAHWMTKANRQLDGKSPLELLQS